MLFAGVCVCVLCQAVLLGTFNQVLIGDVIPVEGEYIHFFI